MSARTVELLLKAQQGMQLLRAMRVRDGFLHAERLASGVAPIHSRSELRSETRARFSSSKIHKASSAESIVKHVLRGRGWSKGWREGRLTGRQHLSLLEDVRQYGRAWFRHEMEGFFEHYGNQGHSGQDRGFSSAPGIVFDLIRFGRKDSEHSTIDVQSELTRSIADRLISPLRRTFDRMRQFVRELIVAGAMVLKGSEPDQADEEIINRSVAVQVDYLDKFQREIELNPPREIAAPTGPGIPSEVIIIQQPRSPAQIAARAELYANAAWQTAQQVVRNRIIKTPVNVLKEPLDNNRIDLVAEPPGVWMPYPVAGPPVAATMWKYERRVLGHPKTEHCTDCPPLAALGWQPIGTLPAIGESECNGLCLCHFEYTDDPTAKKGSKLPPKPRKPDLPGPTGEGGSTIPGESIKPPIKIKPVSPPPGRQLTPAELEELHFKLPPGYEWSS